MHKNVTITLFSILFTILIPFSLAGRGQSEDPIRTARQLVGENRINEAILLLEQTVREDPERIHQAEALLRTIREIRGEYTVLFDQLIDNLVNNPDDIERTLHIIDQMEALDEFPNERVISQIEDARIVAQLAYDRNIVDERMDEAARHLASREYRQAVDIYFSLRELQRDRFEARGYGDIFIDTVDALISRIGIIRDEFFARLEPYRERGELARTAAAGDLTTIDETIRNGFLSQAEELFQVRSDVERISVEVAAVRSQVPLLFPDRPVDWYLNFQETIVRGRPAHRGEEGLAYAVEQAYRDQLAPLIAAGRERTLDRLQTGESSMDANTFEFAAAEFRAAADQSRQWLVYEAALAGLFDDIPPPETVAENYSPDGGREMVTVTGLTDAAESLTDVAAAMIPFNAVPVESGAVPATLASLEERKRTTAGVVDALQNGSSRWVEVEQRYRELPDGYLSTLLDDYLSGTDVRWTSATNRAIDRERLLVQRIAALKTEGIPQAVALMEDEFGELVPLNEGVAETSGEGGEIIRVARYPDEALVGYRSVLERAGEGLATVTEALDTIRNEEQYIRAGAAVVAETDRLASLQDDLSAIMDRAGQGAAVSEELIAESERLVETALERTADMRAAMDSMQVSAAKANYNAVREAYFDSLELRENAEFRRVVDERIQELGSALQELENIIVVRRVRELLTIANNMYTRDEFLGARDALLEAQATWDQTNVTANTEIDRLLRLVTAALSLEEGRELAVTDPLYPILSNYLSIAREDYNLAVSNVEEGREERADVLFDRAVENLRNVRDVRPLNWDARMLELRIAQIRNADDFETVFASRYRQAIARLDEAGPLEVYSELEVLAEINPDYPGMQEQLRRLEIALNLRPDPVDEAEQRQAASLFQRARGLSDGNRDQALVAISLLEEAIQLNPANEEAAFLLDRLRIRVGGEAAVALSTTDEQLFRRAETLFSQGQALQALSIAERLLTQGDNQNYPPLVDLRRRIALRLGI